MEQQHNFKAWVDTMPSPDSKRPTLHVTGSIMVYGKADHKLVDWTGAPPLNKQIYMLEVSPRPTKGDRVQQLKYENPIDTADQYTHVQIQLFEAETITVKIEQVSLQGQQKQEMEGETKD